MAAFERLRRAGLPLNRIRVYVLIGFNDTPADALYRLRTVRGLGVKPSPMRYQPLDSQRRNQHVGEHWTHRELTRYMRYWSNLRFVEAVPFEEWVA
jgi:NADPH-dependent glutamate synthase beta subunit-like oxidoreductase